MFPDKPRITNLEFQEAMSTLAGKGFTQEERNKIRTVFHGDMEEKDLQQGIDREEVERGIKWLRENKNVHHISENKIAILEQELLEKI